MNLIMVDGVKNRIRATPSKKTNDKTETSINYINICFFKYLNCLIKSNVVGGDYHE